MKNDHAGFSLLEIDAATPNCTIMTLGTTVDS